MEYVNVGCNGEIIMEELLEDFKNRMIANNLAQSTAYNYGNNVREFFVKNNINIISDITTEKIMAYCAEYKHDGKDAMEKRFVHAMRAFIKFYELKNVTTPKVKMYKRKVEPIPFTEEELKIMIKYIQENPKEILHPARYIAVLSLIFYTGLRIEEAVNLTRKQFTHGDTLTYRSFKRKKNIEIYLNANLRRTLGDYFSIEAEVNNAFNINRRQVDYVLKKLVEKLELLGKGRKAYPHLLRHSMISNCYNKGLSINDIAHLVGHSNIKQTESYIKVDNQKLKERVFDKIKGISTC
jgi:integrase/recombinase XerD